MSTLFLLILANIPAVMLFRWSLKKSEIRGTAKIIVAAVILLGCFAPALFAGVFAAPEGPQDILGFMFLLFLFPFAALPVMLMVTSGALILFGMKRKSG